MTSVNASRRSFLMALLGIQAFALLLGYQAVAQYNASIPHLQKQGRHIRIPVGEYGIQKLTLYRY